MVKLITQDSYKFGQINNIFPVGKIKISNEGVIEVETEEEAALIVNSEIGFDYFSEIGQATVGMGALTNPTTKFEVTSSVVIELEKEKKALLEKVEDLTKKLDESNAVNEELSQLLEQIDKKEETVATVITSDAIMSKTITAADEKKKKVVVKETVL